MSRRDLQRLRLNPILCDGLGYCAELVPELLTLDEWGYPIVDRRPITDDLWLRHARRAVAACPRVALSLVAADSPARG